MSRAPPNPIQHDAAVVENLLKKGASDGGKSTLASLLVGMRTPQSGLLLLEELDWQTLGMDGWHRRIVFAPQFHENHVLTETSAFNLRMGRRWPLCEGDVKDAEEICRELGLGELIERMPAGLLQMIGETGWQLSHGERSRLYIARALLLRARIIIILDESFAALDPKNPAPLPGLRTQARSYTAGDRASLTRGFDTKLLLSRFRSVSQVRSHRRRRSTGSSSSSLYVALLPFSPQVQTEAKSS
jgi:ABC-type thiamine transport system ATPase subunit